MGVGSRVLDPDPKTDTIWISTIFSNVPDQTSLAPSRWKTPPAHLHVEGVPRPLPPLAGPVVWHRTGRPRPRATRTERRTAPKAGADGLGSEPRASIQGIQVGKHHCAGGGATHLQMASKKGVQRTRGKVLGVNFSSKNGPLTISILTLKRPKGS